MRKNRRYKRTCLFAASCMALGAIGGVAVCRNSLEKWARENYGTGGITVGKLGQIDQPVVVIDRQTKRIPDNDHHEIEEKLLPDTRQENKKEKWSLADAFFYISLIVLVVAVLLVKSGGGGAPVSVFGVSLQNVLTSSMQDEIPKDSLVVTFRTDPETLEIGDDITYLRDENTAITHRIVGIMEDYQGDGQRAFETQGIMNNEIDKYPVPAVNVVGKVIFHNYTMGLVMIFLNKYWYFIVLFLFLISGLGWSIKTWWKAGKAEEKERAMSTAEK